jgi:hypothetical protein
MPTRTREAMMEKGRTSQREIWRSKDKDKAKGKEKSQIHRECRMAAAHRKSQKETRQVQANPTSQAKR